MEQLDSKAILIAMEVILIIILLISSSVINFRTTEFKRDCKIQYDINASCPCKSKIKLVSQPFNLQNNIPNFTLNN